jgi:phosphoglycerate dehydrogenase-like enzyme
VTARLKLVIYAEEADAPAYAAVAARYTEVETRIEKSSEGFIQAVQDADIVCMARKYDKRWLLGATRIKWLHVGGTGIDRLLPFHDLKPDLVISNTPGLNAGMMADYVLCALLMLA